MHTLQRRIWSGILASVFLLAIATTAQSGLRIAPTDPDQVSEFAKTAEPQGPNTPIIAGPTDIKNLDTGLEYATIQLAIDDVLTLDGHTLEVQVATHSEGTVTVTKEVTIQGMAGGAAVLASMNTASSGPGRGWFLVTAANLTVKDLTFDGNGFLIWQGFRITTGGENPSFDNCTFTDIQFNASGPHYAGNAIVQFNSDGLSVTDCTFSQIGRQGIFFFGASVTTGVATGNVYVGKGDGDWLDYGIEVGGGAVITASNNTVTDCRGIALVDSSSSAGMILSTFFGGLSAATVTNNFFNSNTTGIFVGFDTLDVAVLTASDNDLSSNTGRGVIATSTSLTTDASGNWWGSNAVAAVAAETSGDVDFTPWLDVGTDTDLGTAGFQGDFATLNVDDDSPQSGATGRITEGVALVTASTVNVGPGTYEEQVEIDKDVTVLGSGVGSTIIEAPISMPLFFTTSANNRPVVFVHDADDVVIEDLTVDGMGRGNSNNRFVGVAYWNAGGRLTNLDIIRVEDTPFSGVQHGIGLFAANGTGGPYSLEVGNCTISDFQKNAMALTGAGLTVNVHDCATVGKGPTTITAQNGIQISSGAGGTVTDCAISEVDYTPSTYVASGLLTFGASSVAASGLNGANAIVNCQAPISWYDTNGSMDGIETIGGAQFGPIFVYNSSTSKSSQPGAASRVQASAFDADYVAKSAAPRTAASLAVTIDNSCLTGTGFAGSVGIYALSGGALLDVTVTNTIVADWDYGLIADGAATVLTANNNSVTGNLTAGYDNSLSLSPQDAEFNWWGAADGPGGDGPGTGDVVTGGSVDFDPWRIDGTNNAGGCGFLADNNLVTPNPPALCISTVNPCITVPFDIARTDNVSMRGYSVTFTLSANLQLCSGLASIVEDTYLSSVSGTNFLVLDNGGGSYTVDVAILGLPCGATAANGTLFSVDVTNSGGDGTGVITVTSVTMRDCVNAPIPADAGGTANIPIDNTLPSAIADLTAAQVKTGNDADGTTKVALTWSPVEAGATVEVWRKGFGDYPEYDDGTGAVPTAPANPVAAGLAGWTLTTVTASGTTDEVASRDFYYFVAFITDECDNVSAVSNQTDGTLNYHLGDVTDGITPGSGENLVATADISLLGANYGIALAFNDPVNYLDVGPTTDFSVNALPTTDNVVQFEDLMMFAINFGQVSKESEGLVVAAFNELAVDAPNAVQAGQTIGVSLWAAGAGDLQGMSVVLSWNERVLEPLGVETGALLAAQGGLALTAKPGVIDIALLGTRDLALSGEGTLAKAMFRVIGAGDPQVEIVSVDARDKTNQRVDVGVGTKRDDVTQSAPRVTALLQNVPNPFNPMTRIAFTLANAGQVELAIYDVSGRRVQTLVQEHRDAGRYEQMWNGKDESGAQVSTGIYYMRLTTPDGRYSRPMTLLK